MQSKESSDANSELCKEDDDEAMYKNPYEIRLCDLISVSLKYYNRLADSLVGRFFIDRFRETPMESVLPLSGARSARKCACLKTHAFHA